MPVEYIETKTAARNARLILVPLAICTPNTMVLRYAIDYRPDDDPERTATAFGAELTST